MYKKYFVGLFLFVGFPFIAFALDTRPLAEQILSTFPPIKEATAEGSLLLSGGVGYARQFPNGIVIQLKGISQVTNMGCGFSTYANANILAHAQDAKQLVADLNDMPLIQGYISELENSLIKQGKHPQDIQQLKTSIGLALDDFFGFGTALFQGIILGNEGSRKTFGNETILYRLLPTQKDLDTWKGYTELAKLPAIFSPTLNSFANPSIPRQLPAVCMVNIGTTGGHYIATRLERLTNNNFAIIFVDSIQMSEGNFIDKISHYEPYFTQWLNEMPHYFNIQSTKQQSPQPTVPSSGLAKEQSAPAELIAKIEKLEQATHIAIEENKRIDEVNNLLATCLAQVNQYPKLRERVQALQEEINQFIEAINLSKVQPTQTQVTTAPHLGELCPLLLRDLVDAVIRGNSAQIVNNTLTTLKETCPLFDTIEPLQLTTNKTQNSENRNNFIAILATMDPEVQKIIIQQLHALQNDKTLQPDERTLAQELYQILSH